MKSQGFWPIDSLLRKHASLAPTVRASFLVPLAAILGLGISFPTLVPTAQADGRATRSDIMAVKDIKKGMKGYGLTVFEGDKPERFDVEVIDVLHNFKPHQEMILIKTVHPRLDVTKIVGGMSGSPIYIDGKMIGAYAYGWTFGVESVAGVTPIRSMLDDLERPLPKLLHGYPMSVLGGSNKKSKTASSGPGRYRGELADYSVEKHAAQLAKSGDRPRYGEAASRSSAFGAGRLIPVSTPLLMGGMTSDAIDVAARYLGPLGLTPMQAGGGGGKKQSKSASSQGYVDGGAIGVSLVSGDMSAMGLGTVTRVEDNRLVAFGHPMMNIGITSLPTTRGRILWFMASQMRSFKMGEGTGILGALVNDRQSSIVVDENVVAPTVQVSLKVRGEPGAPYEDWNFKVAHDRFLTPSLLGLALGSGLGTTASERRNVTWSMDSVVEFEGYPPIKLDDFGASTAGTPQTPHVMRSTALKAIGQVLNNPWQYARLKRIDMEVKLRFAREVAQLARVDLLTPEVEPGGEARVRLTLEPFDGKPVTRVVSIQVPKKFAGEELKIKIQPGYDVEPPRAAPNNLRELISNLEAGTEARRSLVFSYGTGEGGAAYHGVVAENLPPGALDLLTSTHSTSSPQQFTSQQHQVVKMPLFIVGSHTVSVKVRPGRH